MAAASRRGWLVLSATAVLALGFRRPLIGHLGAASRRLPPSVRRNRMGRALAYLLLDPPTVPATVGDVPLYLRPAGRTLSEPFWSGQYEEAEVRLLASLLEPDVVALDVGANAGLFGLRWAHWGRHIPGLHVVLIEPVPGNVTLIERSVGHNELSDRVTVLPVGLAEVAGHADIRVEGYGNRSGNAALPPGYEARFGRSESVPMARLDELIDEQGLGEVALIKLDVEGAELGALRGAVETIDRDRPVIFGEFNARLMPGFGTSIDDVVELLEPFGYSAFMLGADRGVIEFVPWVQKSNVLFVSHRRRDITLWRLDAAGWNVVPFDPEPVSA